MNKILVGLMHEDEFLNELHKEGILTGDFIYAETEEECTEMNRKAKALYKTNEDYDMGTPVYLECDTDDAEKVQNIYRKVIEDQTPDDFIPYSEGEKRYLNQCHREWCDEFEKKYGYRPKNESKGYID